MKIIRFYFLSFLIILLTGACSNYQKAVRSSDYQEKFTQADLMFKKGNYDKAIALYEQVYQRFPKTEEGKTAYFQLARSFLKLEDYYMAGYYFHQFAVRFPLDDKAEKAMFYTAICSFKNSPGVHFDQDETDIALNDLQTFIMRYPDSKLIDTCNILMDQLRFKLEKKQFNAVKIYNKTGQTRASVVTSKSFLEEYPRSTFINEAAKIQIENAYHLAMNSIFSRKAERIEDAESIIVKYRHLFENNKSYIDKLGRYSENLAVELENVNEQNDYFEIIRAYQNADSSSPQKKVQHLKETITRFSNFAKKYPNSEFYEKAKTYSQKAEKELNNI